MFLKGKRPGEAQSGYPRRTPYGRENFCGSVFILRGGLLYLLKPFIMAVKTKALRQPTGIPKDEMEAAAKWFAMSNMAALELAPIGERNIHRAYNYVNVIIMMETGYSMDGEYKTWLKETRKSLNGDYVTTEWTKQKVNWQI
jgi:hypothetical protein